MRALLLGLLCAAVASPAVAQTGAPPDYSAAGQVRILGTSQLTEASAMPPENNQVIRMTIGGEGTTEGTSGRQQVGDAQLLSTAENQVGTVQNAASAIPAHVGMAATVLPVAIEQPVRVAGRQSQSKTDNASQGKVALPLLADAPSLHRSWKRRALLKECNTPVLRWPDAVAVLHRQAAHRAISPPLAAIRVMPAAVDQLVRLSSTRSF